MCATFAFCHSLTEAQTKWFSNAQTLAGFKTLPALRQNLFFDNKRQRTKVELSSFGYFLDEKATLFCIFRVKFHFLDEKHSHIFK